MTRQLSPSEIAAKAAVKQTVSKLGGLSNAAQFVRVSKSALERYYQVRETEYHVPLDVAMALDEATGEDLILRTWANLRGFDLTVCENKDDIGSCLHAHLGRIGKEVGELLAVMSDHVGKKALSNNEAESTRKEAYDVVRAALEICQMCSAQISENGT